MAWTSYLFDVLKEKLAGTLTEADHYSMQLLDDVHFICFHDEIHKKKLQKGALRSDIYCS